MTNERLRSAFERADLDVAEAARLSGVDPKTVQRWLGGRVPHRRHRWVLAERLEEDEEFLWPGTRQSQSPSHASDEIVAAHAYRSELDTRRWWELFERAEHQIDLLGYTLFFLPQQHPGLGDLLRKKAAAGCRIRIALAEPSSPYVRARDEEEQEAITLVARIQSTLRWLDPLLEFEGIHAHFQDAALYSSIFRFDDQMLVTPHLYGIPGHAAPLLHLRRLGAIGLFSRYESHFEGIWADTRPIGQDRHQKSLGSGV